jgi:hypothetical protein
MDAVQSEDVADKGAERVLLTSCAGIRNSAIVWPKASVPKTAVEQARDNSWCTYATLSETSHVCRKLNRQTPEVETTLTRRKQRTANCSNRQKIQFCKSENPSAAFAKSCPEPFSRRLARFAFLEPNQPISNRELLVLEIPQRAENKHRPTVLIENFEPNCARQREGRSK